MAAKKESKKKEHDGKLLESLLDYISQGILSNRSSRDIIRSLIKTGIVKKLELTREQIIKLIHEIITTAVVSADKKLKKAVDAYETGISYYEKNDYQTARKYFSEALFIFQQKNRDEYLANTYSYLGLAYYKLGDYAEAREYLLKALKIHKKIGNVAGEGNCYTNLGVVCDSLGDYAQAREYHLRALKIDKKIRNVAGEGADYTNLSVL